jgi:hypothetical protein
VSGEEGFGLVDSRRVLLLAVIGMGEDGRVRARGAKRSLSLLLSSVGSSFIPFPLPVRSLARALATAWTSASRCRIAPEGFFVDVNIAPPSTSVPVSSVVASSTSSTFIPPNPDPAPVVRTGVGVPCKTDRTGRSGCIESTLTGTTGRRSLLPPAPAPVAAVVVVPLDSASSFSFSSSVSNLMAS